LAPALTQAANHLASASGTCFLRRHGHIAPLATVAIADALHQHRSSVLSAALPRSDVMVGRPDELACCGVAAQVAVSAGQGRAGECWRGGTAQQPGY